jgi:hypothetical protein
MRPLLFPLFLFFRRDAERQVQGASADRAGENKNDGNDAEYDCEHTAQLADEDQYEDDNRNYDTDDSVNNSHILFHNNSFTENARFGSLNEPRESQ